MAFFEKVWYVKLVDGDEDVVIQVLGKLYPFTAAVFEDGVVDDAVHLVSKRSPYPEHFAKMYSAWSREELDTVCVGAIWEDITAEVLARLEGM